MYRIGFPGWKLAARLGVRLVLRIDVMHDIESGAYIATSPDLHGLVVEEKELSALWQSIHDCTEMLLQSHLDMPKIKSSPYVAWDGQAVPA